LNIEKIKTKNKRMVFDKVTHLKIQSIFISLCSYVLVLNTIAYSQLQNTWELIMRHETCFRVQNQTDTSLTDTTIIENSQTAFYKYTEDSVYIYDLDYGDSKEKNCYMLWSSPYKLLNDTAFDFSGTQNPGVQISATYKIVNDTLIYTEKWLEDQPDYIYHQTKVLYFFNISCFGLPPTWWPQSECNSSDAIQNVRLPRPAVLYKNSKTEYNLLGQSMYANSSGIRISKNAKRIALKINRK
jgi:hypothetical protein